MKIDEFKVGKIYFRERAVKTMQIGHIHHLPVISINQLCCYIFAICCIIWKIGITFPVSLRNGGVGCCGGGMSYSCRTNDTCPFS